MALFEINFSKARTILVLEDLLLLKACGGHTKKAGAFENMTGGIHIDGSSPVYPVTEAVAEVFILYFLPGQVLCRLLKLFLSP